MKKLLVLLAISFASCSVSEKQSQNLEQDQPTTFGNRSGQESFIGSISGHEYALTSVMGQGGKVLAVDTETGNLYWAGTSDVELSKQYPDYTFVNSVSGNTAYYMHELDNELVMYVGFTFDPERGLIAAGQRYGLNEDPSVTTSAEFFSKKNVDFSKQDIPNSLMFVK